MNEEEKTITTNEPAAEKQTKPAKPKRTDEEKLQECYEKRDRLREQKTAHKNKGQVLGHTDASFTLDTYTHGTGDMQRNAMTVVKSMIQQFLFTEIIDGKD